MIVKAKCLFCEATIEGERDYMLSGTGLRRDGRCRPQWLKELPEFHWTWNGLGEHLFYLCPNHKDKLNEGFEWCKEQMKENILRGGERGKQWESPQPFEPKAEVAREIFEEVRKIENPYSPIRQCADEDGVIRTYENIAHTRVEDIRQAILRLESKYMEGK